MTRAPRPVESFGPEILATLLQGATGCVKMQTTYKMGIRFRMRVHQLREAMRVYGHEKYKLCSRVRVSITFDDRVPTTRQGRHNVPVDRNVDAIVTLQPNDIEFGDILRAAGVDPLAGVTSHDIPGNGSDAHPISELEEMLKDLQ